MNCIDIDRLNRKIEERSTTREAIAHEIGIDITTFNRRVKSGKLLIGDIHKMCMILQLSSTEAMKSSLQRILHKSFIERITRYKNRKEYKHMMQNVKGIKKVTDIDYSVAYTVNETAQLFSCLSTEARDEILSIMREMVARNKAAQGQR